MLPQFQSSPLDSYKILYKPKPLFWLRRYVLTPAGKKTRIYHMRYHDGLVKSWFYYTSEGRFLEHDLKAAA